MVLKFDLKCLRVCSGSRTTEHAMALRSGGTGAVLTIPHCCDKKKAELEVKTLSTLRDRIRTSAICERLGVETWLLSVDRCQERWCMHLVRMPTGYLKKEIFQSFPPWGGHKAGLSARVCSWMDGCPVRKHKGL